MSTEVTADAAHSAADYHQAHTTRQTHPYHQVDPPPRRAAG